MNAKLTIAAGLVALLFGTGATSAQQYAPPNQQTTASYSAESGAPSSIRAGANSYATSELGSTLEGAGAMAAGAGQYNLNSAMAVRHLEEARGRYIQNYRDAIDARFAIKRAHDTYWAEKFAQERPTPELLSRIIQAKLPDRLSAAEYNPRTGDLKWPAVLMSPEFAADRRAVQNAFAQRRGEDVGMTSVFYRDVSERTQRMQSTMVAEIDKISTADSVAARKFLKSLEFEARHLPAETSLAINER